MNTTASIRLDATDKVEHAVFASRFADDPYVAQVHVNTHQVSIYSRDAQIMRAFGESCIAAADEMERKLQSGAAA